MVTGSSTAVGWVARLDDARCNGCRVCLPTCDFGALLWVTSDAELLVDPWACTGCGACVSVCPERAVVLEQRSP